MTEHPAGAPRIVVGVDGSAQSKLALRWAQRLAAAEHCGIDAVIAWEFPTSMGWGAALPSGYSPHADMEKLLTHTVDEVFCSERPPDLRLLAYQGNPSSVLREASKHARMVIVGSRGHGGFTGLLLGSVSAAMAHHSVCPVLIARGEPIEAPA